MSSSRRSLILVPLVGLLLTGSMLVAAVLTGAQRADSAADSTAVDQRGRFTAGTWQQGETLYRQNCARCHAPNLQGRCMAPSLVGVTGHMRDEAIVAHARKIGETMCCARHIRNLTDAEFRDIVAYFHAVDTDPTVKRRAERASGSVGCRCSR
jgi:mono/diheme cytochrome c family protein